MFDFQHQNINTRNTVNKKDEERQDFLRLEIVKGATTTILYQQ